MNSIINLLLILMVNLCVYMCEDLFKCNYDKSLNLNVTATQVFFYDFKEKINITSPINQAADLITTLYNFDVTRKMIIFVPDYRSERSDEHIITQTYRDVPNIYLIIFNRGSYKSVREKEDISYSTAVLNSYYLGRSFGEFLAKLKAKGYPSKNFHCIGFSLGAQILGYTGEAYTNITSEKIWRITGLDPAGWCFSNSSMHDQIRSGVAEYVEVYHCSSEHAGTANVLADTDFFFNEEYTKRPHCKGISSCSHLACLKYLAMSVQNNKFFLARRCHSYRAFILAQCDRNQVTIAGYHNPGNATGVFYVPSETYYPG